MRVNKVNVGVDSYELPNTLEWLQNKTAHTDSVHVHAVRDLDPDTPSYDHVSFLIEVDNPDDVTLKHAEDLAMSELEMMRDALGIHLYTMNEFHELKRAGYKHLEYITILDVEQLPCEEDLESESEPEPEQKIMAPVN